MPQTKIEAIFKPEVVKQIKAGTFKINYIDYSTPKKQAELKRLAETCRQNMRNGELSAKSIEAANRPMTI